MAITENTALLKEWIDSSDNIVFFGGAGVSTESGIPDFRSVDGIYNMKYKYPPETILSRTFFCNHISEFYEFYKDKMLYLDAKPNKAHLALAELERRGKLKAVITQNIDGLHQAAGSKTVYELHGSVHRNYCVRCGAMFDAEYIKILPLSLSVHSAAVLSSPMWCFIRRALTSTLLTALSRLSKTAMFLSSAAHRFPYIPPAALSNIIRATSLFL